MASSSSEVGQGVHKYPQQRVYEILLTVMSGFSLPEVKDSELKHGSVFHSKQHISCLCLSKALEIPDPVRAGEFFEKWVLWVPEQCMEILQSDPHVIHFEITKSFYLSRINVFYYQSTESRREFRERLFEGSSRQQRKPWDPEIKLKAGELHVHVKRYFPLAIDNSVHADESSALWVDDVNHRVDGRYEIEEYWLPDSLVSDFEHIVKQSGGVYQLIPLSCQLQVRVMPGVKLGPLIYLIEKFSCFTRLEITDNPLVLLVNFPTQVLPQLYFLLALRPEIEDITCQDDASLDAGLQDDVKFIKAILEKNEAVALQILEDGQVHPDACYYLHGRYGFIPALILALEVNLVTLAERLVERLLSKPESCSIITPDALFGGGISMPGLSHIQEKLDIFVQMQPDSDRHETCMTMSHWQIACILNHKKTMEFLLAKGLAPKQDSHAITALRQYKDHLSSSQEKAARSTPDFFPKPKDSKERFQLVSKLQTAILLLQCLGSLEGIKLPPALQEEDFQQILLSACTPQDSTRAGQGF